MIFGFAMMVSGIQQQRHDARVRREIGQAEAEWATLLAEAADSHRHGEGFVRLLQRHGYRNFFVRRWLGARLELALAHGGSRRLAEPDQAMTPASRGGPAIQRSIVAKPSSATTTACTRPIRMSPIQGPMRHGWSRCEQIPMAPKMACNTPAA